MHETDSHGESRVLRDGRGREEIGYWRLFIVASEYNQKAHDSLPAGFLVLSVRYIVLPSLNLSHSVLLSIS